MCKVQYKEDTTIRTVAPLSVSAQLNQFYFRLYKENIGSQTRVTWVNFWNFINLSEIWAIQSYLPSSITSKNCSTDWSFSTIAKHTPWHIVSTPLLSSSCPAAPEVVMTEKPWRGKNSAVGIFHRLFYGLNGAGSDVCGARKVTYFETLTTSKAVFIWLTGNKVTQKIILHNLLDLYWRRQYKQTVYPSVRRWGLRFGVGI